MDSQEEEQAFARRASVTRSPPVKMQDPKIAVDSKNETDEEPLKVDSQGKEIGQRESDDEVVFLNESVTQTDKKRKFRFSPEMNKQDVNIKDKTLKKIYNKIKSMHDFKEATPNVHKALKDAIGCLRSWTYSYAKELEEEEDEKQDKILKLEEECRKVKEEAADLKKEVIKLTKENEQPYAKELEEEEDEKQDKILKLEEECRKVKEEATDLKKEVIRLTKENEELRTERRVTTWRKRIKKEDVEKITCFKKLEAVIDNIWEEDTYENVKEKSGTPLQSEDELSLLIIEPTDPEMQSYIQKSYREAYPQLKEIQGEWGLLRSTTTITDGDLINEKTKTLIKITPKDLGAGLWELLIRVREKMLKDGTTRVTIHRLATKSEGATKKMLQSIFNQTNVIITQYKPAVPRLTQTRQAKKEYATKAIEIHKKGEFKHTLTEVKKSLALTQIKDDIRTIRSTRAGTLLIVLNKEVDTANVEKKLKEDIPESRVNGLGHQREAKNKQFFIRNMDATVTKNEIQEELNRLARAEGEAKVGEVRPGRADTLSVTVSAPPKIADKLVALKYIKVGLSEGQIEEKMEVMRCYRCWGYGHLTKTCTSTDRRGNCYRCGEEGHLASSCSAEPRCPICNLTGHMAGGTGCKEKRKEVRRARGRRPSVEDGNLPIWSEEMGGPPTPDPDNNRSAPVIRGRPSTPTPPTSPSDIGSVIEVLL